MQSMVAQMSAIANTVATLQSNSVEQATQLRQSMVQQEQRQNEERESMKRDMQALQAQVQALQLAVGSTQTRGQEAAPLQVGPKQEGGNRPTAVTVSYTHLTLPTICSV
eukprot:2538339-Alexandrium_andersonii.AAC.1